MLIRVFSFLLIATLALPLAVSTQTVEAKSKTKTVTFTSTVPITLPGSGIASPYPSEIVVKGLKKGQILDVNVLINGYSEPAPDDIDVLLATTQLPGSNAIIMSDVGDAQAISNVNLVLDDAATNSLPDSDQIISGTFKPTNIDSGGVTDMFPSPAPTPSGNSLLSVFNNQNPNGTWQLFINDNAGNGAGSITSWGLEITAKVKVKKHKH